MKKVCRRAFNVLLLVGMVTLAACGRQEETEKDTYTYNTSLPEFPVNWSPFQYRTAIDDEILKYITEAFYVFDYNENLDGYQLVPGAAAAEPVDVTADYIGEYGIEEGDLAKAWKIPLREDLMWEDGTPITAWDFVRSAELMLAPEAQNYRADSLYAGNLTIVNARNYLYAGQYGYISMISAAYAPEEYVDMDNLTETPEGTLQADGKDILLKLDSCSMWDTEIGLEDLYQLYPEAFLKEGTDWYEKVLLPAADEEGYVRLTQELLFDLRDMLGCLKAGSLEAYEEEEGEYAFWEWQEFCFYGQEYPEIQMEDVGIFAISDTELILVLEKPLEGFYLLYELTNPWLVNEELYLSCAESVNGVYTNSYGTSAEMTMSYGPYTLASFQSDKQFVLERNENFHGVKEGNYQTTACQVECVPDSAAALELFLSGKLDAYMLNAEDMKAYAGSTYTYYTTQETTYFVACNPDRKALEEAQQALGEHYNKTILTVKEFRQALSFALDRSAFALAAMPTCNPAYGIYSDLIVANPQTGETYRSREEAKWVLADFWGVSGDIGEGKLYADVDEAVDGITGYNLQKAKQLFNEAYEIALTEGLIKEDDIIEIKIGMPDGAIQAYTRGYEFLVNCYTDAVKGTKLEGRLTFTKDDTLGNAYGEALKTNQVDLLFLVGFTGSALDPYYLITAYTTPEYQYNPAWDTSAEYVSVMLGDKTYTASVADWTRYLNREEIRAYDENGKRTELVPETGEAAEQARFMILTALEHAVLDTYSMIPLADDSVASLKGMQVRFYTEEFIFGVERGGIKYMTYDYTDAEWEAFVASRGGQLLYK